MLSDMKKTLAVTALAVLALTGCASKAPAAAPATIAQPTTATPVEATPEPEPTKTAKRANVPWSDYDASVQAGIDAQTEAKDCAGLQAAFETTDANNEATMSRTGHNNADLLRYIDESLRLAGCY